MEARIANLLSANEKLKDNKNNNIRTSITLAPTSTTSDIVANSTISKAAPIPIPKSNSPSLPNNAQLPQTVMVSAPPASAMNKTPVPQLKTAPLPSHTPNNNTTASVTIGCDKKNIKKFSIPPPRTTMKAVHWTAIKSIPNHSLWEDVSLEKVVIKLKTNVKSEIKESKEKKDNGMKPEIKLDIDEFESLFSKIEKPKKTKTKIKGDWDDKDQASLVASCLYSFPPEEEVQRYIT